MNDTAFCVTGWHFPSDFYRSLAALDQVDVFVLSHKGRAQIPAEIYDLIPGEKILNRSNIGYDWGCYQQFLASGIYQDYETVFFMHDDIQIHDFGFIPETKKLLEKHAVIGNGRGQGSVSHTSVDKHPYAYAHSSWKPASFHFSHSTVRGSYFAASRRVLAAAYPFEVYWDPFKLNIEFGNWSTKATCGKLEGLFGPDCFGYLSDTHGKSQYITEHYRGAGSGSSATAGGFKEDLYLFLKKISVVYQGIYYHQREIKNRKLWLAVIRALLWLFSSKLY